MYECHWRQTRAREEPSSVSSNGGNEGYWSRVKGDGEQYHEEQMKLAEEDARYEYHDGHKGQAVVLK